MDICNATHGITARDAATEQQDRDAKSWWARPDSEFELHVAGPGGNKRYRLASWR
jgi:hypothetical protein